MKKLIIKLPKDENEWLEFLGMIIVKIREGYLAGEGWNISEE